MVERSRFRQNLFEIDNARNLTRDELVSTFVPTKAFWRLLSAKHHVILGSRGSGKTALAKMLSHDHLAGLSEPRAQRIVQDRAFIGIYVPTELEWVGGLKNKPWQTEREKEEFFQWRLNVSTCMALLVTLKSCLETYFTDRGRRAFVEADLASAVGRAWGVPDSMVRSLGSVESFLEDTELAKQRQIAELRAVGEVSGGFGTDRAVGVGFAMDLFVPLRAAIRAASRILEFSEDCSWLLCLDEAEFLEPMHQRILNSYLRAYSKNLYFNITTMPYCHYTLATNTGVTLDAGHDFEYVYIDQDPVIWAGEQGQEGKTFADTIFRKRAKISGAKYRWVSLKDLLGTSPLLESKSGDWSPGSRNIRLLQKYASRKTLRRAQRLSVGSPKFMDQIARKILPALMLRESLEKRKGREELEIYSGELMAIRCGDANPRRLIRIFNRFLRQARWDRVKGGRRGPRRIPNKQQPKILKTFSESILNPVQSEEQVGPELHDLLIRIGNYMQHALHAFPLSSDQVSSVTVNLKTSPYAKLVKRAAALGLLFPNVGSREEDQMPLSESKFHLAYVLAPLFEILPRKGKSVSLDTLMSRPNVRKGQLGPDQAQQQQFTFAPRSVRK